MWLVLCSANDIDALWAARGLAARGLHPLEILTAEALAYSPQLVHRLCEGQASVSIRLADGRTIDGSSVRGTLNRLQTIPSAHLYTADPRDRQYAEQELFSLYLSWLHGLPGLMFNRPTPQGLCGSWRQPLEWVWLAGQSGLQTTPYRQSETTSARAFYYQPAPTTRTVIVVQGACYGAASNGEVAAGCSRLAKLSETPLLGCDFDVMGSGEWTFRTATPLPNLRLGGEQLQDGLAEALTR